jgi:hypothetical protein
MWRIWRAPNNASKWHLGFNLAFKGLNIVLFSRQKALTGFSWRDFWKVPNLIIFTFCCSMEKSASLCNCKSSSLPTCVIYFQDGKFAHQHYCARLHACHQPLSERASICILTHALTKRRANKSCLWHLRNVFLKPVYVSYFMNGSSRASRATLSSLF